PGLGAFTIVGDTLVLRTETDPACLVDSDGDGAGDCVDNCLTAPNPDQQDADGDGFGDACDAVGDCDHDGEVDLFDFAPFPNCLGGPGVPLGPTTCECIDLNADGDVDLRDFAGFQAGFTGP
ncbi:MAG: dockerin type I domain-containing protein, partial [Planctomycetota bacterium]